MPSQSGLEEVYSELRRIAAAHLNRRTPSPSLQPTLLVHEAWLRLSGKSWNSKTHFLATASRAMRNILVESIRRRMAAKRDGACRNITITSAPEVAAAPLGLPLPRLLELDQALDRLAALSPRRASVVEMRFFGGMEFTEIAEALEVSLITVKRDWAFSRVWLYEALSAEPPSPEPQ